jgi:hypothetical protein
MKSKISNIIWVIIILFFVVAIIAIKYHFSNISTIKTTTSISGSNYTLGSSMVYYQGQNVSNFLIQKINSNNVTGLSYIWYPVATTKGTPTTLHMGDTVGYNCDGSLKILTTFNSTSVTFTNVSTGSKYGGCPICLSGTTYIDTPNGPVNIKEVHTGENVWTTDQNGSRQIGIILKTSKTFVSSSHLMVHIILSDGRQLFASPGHPTSDNRTFGNLSVGEYIDHSRIESVQLVQYNQSYTYDILPSGPTGFYYADGILVGSTIKNN